MNINSCSRCRWEASWPLCKHNPKHKQVLQGMTGRVEMAQHQGTICKSDVTMVFREPISQVTSCLTDGPKRTGDAIDDVAGSANEGTVI